MTWPLVELNAVAGIVMGQSPEGSYYNRVAVGKPLITGSGQMGNLYPCPSQFSSLGAKEAKAGDIIISIRASIGDLNWSDRDYYIGRGVAAIRPGELLNPRYAWWALSRCRSGLESLATGSTFKQIKTDTLATLRIPLPPLQEQRRIAAILDQAEALRSKRRQALAKLDTLTQSLFLETFGDPERDSRWKRTQLGTLIVDGPQNGLYRHSEDYGSGTPILRIDAFYDGLVTSLASLKRLRLSDQDVHHFSLTEGDLVINRVNSIEYLGKSAIIPRLDEATVFESNMMRFRVDGERMNSTFLIHLLQTALIRRQILSCAKDAVNQSSINQKDVSSLRVVVPPLFLQNEFSKRALTIVQNGYVLKTAAKAMNTLFSSLQHRAFNGEL